MFTGYWVRLCLLVTGYGYVYWLLGTVMFTGYCLLIVYSVRLCLLVTVYWVRLCLLVTGYGYVYCLLGTVMFAGHLITGWTFLCFFVFTGCPSLDLPHFGSETGQTSLFRHFHPMGFELDNITRFLGYLDAEHLIQK